MDESGLSTGRSQPCQTYPFPSPCQGGRQLLSAQRRHRVIHKRELGAFEIQHKASEFQTFSRHIQVPCATINLPAAIAIEGFDAHPLLKQVVDLLTNHDLLLTFRAIHFIPLKVPRIGSNRMHQKKFFGALVKLFANAPG
jgi:hypothetical protein